MRPLVLAISVVLLATACGGDDGAEGTGPDTDVCDRLSLADASRIAGVTYTANGQSGDICIYARAGTDQAFKLSVIAYRDGYAEVLADSEDLGYTASPVSVAGADRAVSLAGRNRSVVAEQDGKAYEVTFNGDVATAARLMAVVLGGADAGPAPEPVASPCGSLSPGEVGRLLGVPAKPRAGTDDVALKACTWRDGTRELVVAAARGRGPASEFWDENFFVGRGVEPERLRLPGADGALLVSGEDGVVGLAVASGDLSYVVTVAGGVTDPRAVARQVAAGLLAGG